MRFQIKSYEIASGKIRDSIEQLSFVQLSDLHLQQFGEGNAALMESIVKIQPDAVLVTGDMITARSSLATDQTEKFLAELAGKFPVYYANGNHEQKMKLYRETYGDHFYDYREKLKKAGVVFLENKSVQLEMQGVPVRLYGLELPLGFFRRFRNIRLKQKDIYCRIGKPDPEYLNILLAHHPRFWDTYAGWGADITLSGHIHGGVLRFGRHAALSPDGRIFPRYGYGLYKKEDKSLIVSAGLGEHTFPFRILNPREMVHIIIKQEAPHGDTR